ncbi:protease complex subunit PrcB family protein [Flavobacterium sp. CECT 9288]|uniref:protease complex subunit PrcB family protein n=1 Tax=Flavobacterium sp. CECT 9288 TaxID=2845819 RepID=UPI001E38C662|nr:protease complex subunit PrcB family protein [Flavobacterium sp. CECT 9288]
MRKIVMGLMMITLFSCATGKPVATDSKKLYEVLTEQTYGGAAIRFYEILSEPNEIRMLQKDENLKNSIKPSDLQSSNFVILNMGQKSSGGYSINVEGVVETPTQVIIKVKETGPEPGGMVTQAMTNPFCVVKINSKKEIIFQ